MWNNIRDRIMWGRDFVTCIILSPFGGSTRRGRVDKYQVAP
jgi:hypothetical protein